MYDTSESDSYSYEATKAMYHVLDTLHLCTMYNVKMMINYLQYTHELFSTYTTGKLNVFINIFTICNSTLNVIGQKTILDEHIYKTLK